MNRHSEASVLAAHAALKCHEAMAKLHRYIDEELTLHELEHMQAHLDECRNCWNELRMARGLRDLLRRSCTEKAPDELRSRVTDRIATLRRELATPTP
ncbi:MAG: mycothiol system anti-sigma-R factor [Bifidobacteriaceae bacterium]|jgi:anti-sigma factor (TIGR02949 family)|nr:mycothiol system anti-sigma-R factor [Bifidobacteriaceae bacterium]